MGSNFCHQSSHPYGPYGPKHSAGDEICDRAPKCVGRCDAPCSIAELRSREEDILTDWTKLEYGLAASSSRPKPLRRPPVIGPGCLVTRYHGMTGGIGASVSYQAPLDPAEVYELKPRPIGFGSFGEVLLARHKKTRVLRALKKKSKVPKKRLLVEDEEDRQTINPIIERSKRRQEEVREVDVLLRLDHPNVVKLFEVFEDEDSVCLAMELLKGGSLLERIVPSKASPRGWEGAPSRCEKHQQGRSLALSEQEAAHCFWQMLSAVLHLHGHRVVHRDIKLEHFIFSSTDEKAQLKLVDFGHAWPLKPFRTPHGVVETEGVVLMVVQELTIPGGAGTHRYVAPEIQDESEVAAHLADRADTWALGVCLHAMLTGRLLPQRGLTQASDMDMLSAVPEAKLAGISSLASDLLQELLRLRPEKRPTVAAIARHPWLALAANEDLAEAATLIRPRFMADLSIVMEALSLRRLFLLVVAHQLEDAEAFPFQCLFRALEAQCRGPLTEQAMATAIQRLGHAQEQTPSQQLLLQGLKAVFCVMGAIDADASGSIGWTEFMAAILLTQDEVLAVLRKKQLQETAFERACFRAFDSLSEGEPKITPTTLARGLRPRKALQAQKHPDAEAMFNELDWRHALSLEDFLKVIDGAELSKVVQLEEPLPPLPPPKDSRSEEEHGKKTWGGTEEFIWDES